MRSYRFSLLGESHKFHRVCPKAPPAASHGASNGPTPIQRLSSHPIGQILIIKPHTQKAGTNQPQAFFPSPRKKKSNHPNFPKNSNIAKQTDRPTNQPTDSKQPHPKEKRIIIIINMHLMYLPDANPNAATAGRRYTLKKVLDGQVTKSAHPARFSPDDKWSRHRITLRRRFGLLLTEKSMCFYSLSSPPLSSPLLPSPFLLPLL